MPSIANKSIMLRVVYAECHFAPPPREFRMKMLTPVGSDFTHKHWTRLERLARDKR
jgi:hypothetical protein